MTPAEPAQPNGHASVQPHQAQPSAARPQRVLSSGTLSDGERSDQGTTSHRHSRKPSEEEASEAPVAVFCPPGVQLHEPACVQPGCQAEGVCAWNHVCGPALPQAKPAEQA